MIVPKVVFHLHDDDDIVKEVQPDRDHVFSGDFDDEIASPSEQTENLNNIIDDGAADEESENEDANNYCSFASPWSNEDDTVQESRRSFSTDDHKIGGPNTTSFNGVVSPSLYDDYGTGDADDSSSQVCSISQLYGPSLDRRDSPPTNDEDQYNICSISDLQSLASKQQDSIDEDVFTSSFSNKDGASTSGPTYSPDRGGRRREGVDMSILPSIADIQALDCGTERELPRKQSELAFGQPMDAAVTLQSPEEEESVDGIWFRTGDEVGFLCVSFIDFFRMDENSTAR